MTEDATLFGFSSMYVFHEDIFAALDKYGLDYYETEGQEPLPDWLEETKVRVVRCKDENDFNFVLVDYFKLDELT